MKLCNNNNCNNITGNYAELCRKCKPRVEQKIKKYKTPKIPKIPKVYKIYNLSYKERYGLIKTDMPKQITLKRDKYGNII